MPSKIAKKSNGGKKKKNYGVMKKIKKYGPGVAAAALALGTTVAGAYSAYNKIYPENPNPMGKKGSDWRPDDDEDYFEDLERPEGMAARVKQAFADIAADEDAREIETQAEFDTGVYPENPSYVPIPNPYLLPRPSPFPSQGLPTVEVFADWKRGREESKIKSGSFY